MELRFLVSSASARKCFTQKLYEPQLTMLTKALIELLDNDGKGTEKDYGLKREPMSKYG